MAREIVMTIANAVRCGASASDIEDICRYVVAQEMEDEDVILDDGTVEEIVNDVIDDEAYLDTIEGAISDDGIVEMTDAEWSNYPSDSKVIDTDGEDAIVVSGKVHKVRISADSRRESIAHRIKLDMEAAMGIRDANYGYHVDYDSYNKTANSAFDMVCPYCDSFNVTPMWYADDEAYIHCNDCGEEFELAVPDDELVDIASATVEDVDIAEDVLGSIYYDGDEGWTYQIWAYGECVLQDTADDADEIYAIFDAVAAIVEDDMHEGGIIHYTETGDDEQIINIEEGEVVTTAGSHNAYALAARVASGKVILNNSNVHFANIVEGSCYSDKQGNEYTVMQIDGRNVIYAANEMDEDTHEYGIRYMLASKDAFADMIFEKSLTVQ